MAKVTSPFPISGTLGQIEFFQANGKTFVRQRRNFNKKKWLRPTNSARRAAESFGGASAVSNAIYRTLKRISKASFPNYTTNKITAKIQTQAYNPRTTTDAYTLESTASAFRNLELSAPKQKALLTATGPSHNPTSVQIKNLRQIARDLDPDGTKSLQCRIQQICISFPEVHFEKADRKWQRKDALSTKAHATLHHHHTTNWIDQDLIEKEALRLSLRDAQNDSQENTISFIVIQWRTQDGELKDQTTIKCVAVHLPIPDKNQDAPEHFQVKPLPNRSPRNTRKLSGRPQIRPTKQERKKAAYANWPPPQKQ